MKTKNLNDSLKLLNDIVKMIRRYGSNLTKPGNREHFEIARHAAIDTVWSINTLIRELQPVGAVQPVEDAASPIGAKGNVL